MISQVEDSRPYQENMTETNARRSVIAHIRRSRRPLLVSHKDPDPDSLGSVLGLAAVFKELGVAPVVAVHRPDTIDDVLAQIPGLSQILPLTRSLIDSPPDAQPFDALFTLDTATPELFSVDDETRQALLSLHPLINIDHHVTNSCYGDVNYVVADAAAAAEVVWLLVADLHARLPVDGAIALQAGLVADTLGFQTKDTRPRTLRASAGLLDLGGETSGVARRVLNSRTYESARLLGAALAGAERTNDGRLVWTTVSAEMAADVGVTVGEARGIPNALQDIADVVIAVVFYEIEPDETRISLRSHGPRIDEIAAEFGGGGHALAAGASVDASVAEVSERVVNRLKQVLLTSY